MMSYSVIIPVYNSEASIESHTDQVLKTLKELKGAFEVILVDDYSSDGSWEVLKRIKKRHPELIRIVRFAKNYGQHNATLCGFRISKGQVVITLDDDGEHRPQDIPLLIRHLKQSGADVVYGVPSGKPQKPRYRRIGTSFWNNNTRRFDEARGEGTSFRALRSSLVEQVIQHRQHFIYIDEILNWYTDVIELIPVVYGKSQRKKSRYSSSKLFFMGVNLAVFYSSVPLKLMIIGGLVMSVVTFLIGTFFIYKKIVHQIAVPGYTSIIVSIFFSTSLLLVCLGVIGQYLGRIHASLNRKPTYSIREQQL